MKARIIERPPGSKHYTIVLQLGLGSDGKRKQRWIACPGNKHQAEQMRAELMHEQANGTLVAPNKITVGQYLAQWLKSVQGNLSPRTVEGYTTIINRIIPSLGAIPLTALRPDTLQKYYTDCLETGRMNKQGGLNPLTVRHHHTLLHRALKNAMEWGLIMRNPADAAHPPPSAPPEIHIMSEDEIQTFLEAAKQTPYYDLYFTVLYTGLRRSEVLALRWSDIDLLGCQLSVSRSIHRLRDGSYIFRQPKSAKGKRMVALSPSATHVLRQHREKMTAERLLSGIPLKDGDLVFAKSDGSPIRPNTVTRAWPMLAVRAGLKPIRLHDARHTHASLMLKQGIHPKIVQERLGHATISVTLDTYWHVAPGLQEAAAQKFDDMGLLPKLEKEVAEKLG